MKAMLLVYLIVSVILVEGIYSLSAHGQTCQNPLAPPTDARGVNRLDRDSNIPLFQLGLSNKPEADLSRDGKVTYRVEVSAVNDQFPFNNARISIASPSLCGSGSLTFDRQLFTKTRQNGSTCAMMVSTVTKYPVVELPFLAWKPPACGCVQFRAMIISLDNVYYMDNEEVENGPLTQTICVHRKDNREIHLTSLCQVLDRYSATEIISRNSFLERHQVGAKWIDKHGFEMGLELRRSDNKLCCKKDSLQDKLNCFDDSRRRRVDKFCEDGYPDIPLTSFRLSHMLDRENECCFLLGEHRYKCFAENSSLIHGPAVTVLDFSQDETDPVNDLAEFASVQDTDVMRSVGAITNGGEESNDDNVSEDDEKDDLDENDKDSVYETRNRGSIHQPPNKKGHVKTEGGRSTPDGSRGTGISRNFHGLQVHGPNEGKKSRAKAAPQDENQLPTSSERQKKTRNKGEHQHRQSAERISSRRVSSREYTPDGRRASGERTGRKRASGEKLKSVSGTYPRITGYVDTYPRRTGTSRESEITSSAERRARLTASGQRLHDWRVAIDKPTEDQKGTSGEVTLDILQRKIDRLHLKQQCCEAGTKAGHIVYGMRSTVQRECEHSREKYLTVMSITSGIKSCLEQFLKCCIEKAVSGPVITSSEFVDKQYKHGSNFRRFGLLERQEEPERPAAKGFEQEELYRGIPRLESPEAYEEASERRFQSMRETELVPQNDEDEINGPKNFDETDNNLGNSFDILDRSDEMVVETDEFDDKDVIDTEDADKRGGSSGGISNEQKKKRKENGNKNGSKNDKNKKYVAKDKLDRVSDLVRGREKQERDTSQSYEDSLLAKASRGRSSNYKYNQAGGRSLGRKSSSRESRRRTSRESTSKSQERREYAHTYYSNKRAHKTVPSGKIGTLDSREMAAAHSRKFIGNLDSKEMVDAYRKIVPRQEEVLNDGPKYRLPKKKLHRLSRRRFTY